MSGIFSSPKVDTPPPLAAQAPVTEASFQPGGDKTDTTIKTAKLGKQKLFIPTNKNVQTTASTTTSLGGIA